MKKIMICCALLSLSLAAPVMAAESGQGEKDFQEHCSACHPNGGNIINPKKTLHRKDREANGVKTADDIVRLMRHPGPGMQTFDKAAVSDEEARGIAEYVIKTFK